MSTSRIHSRLTLVGSLVAIALLSSQAFARQSNVERVVTFGASLSDTGNAFTLLSQPENQSCWTQLNVPPYDELDDLLTPGAPYARGGHHFTNGATWIEGLARYLALAGNARPALQNPGLKANNYAVGGARAVADYPCRFNLPAQVSAYLADFPATSDRALVAIEIGGNDVRDALVAALQAQNPQAATPYIQNALGSLADSVTQLHFHGARQFLLLNVPDVGKTPAVRILDQSYQANGQIVGLARYLSQAYNSGLAGVVQGLNALPGIDVRVLDAYAILDAVVADPATYGFLNATEACVTPNQPPFTCTKPDTYAFWDGIHPTKALHDLVAQQAIELIAEP